MAVTASPERVSVLIGVLVAIVATLPRYIVYGNQGRLVLILVVFVLVAAFVAVTWRLLDAAARHRLPVLLGRLLLMLLAGGVLVAIWQWFADGHVQPLLLLSHGATLGLLLHALVMGLRQRQAWR